jgi:hypothetical protein
MIAVTVSRWGYLVDSCQLLQEVSEKSNIDKDGLYNLLLYHKFIL